MLATEGQRRANPHPGNLRAVHGGGFVSIHNGIHGGSELNPQQPDWCGPIAVISIEQIRD